MLRGWKGMGRKGDSTTQRGSYVRSGANLLRMLLLAGGTVGWGICLGADGCSPTAALPDQVAGYSSQISTSRNTEPGAVPDDAAPDATSSDATTDPAAGSGGASGGTGSADPVAPEQVAGWTPFQTDGSATPAVHFQKSVTPTPRSWNAEGFTEVFAITPVLAGAMSICDPVDWWQLEGRAATSSRAYQAAQWQKTLLGSLQVFVQVDPYPGRIGPVTNLPANFPNPTFANPLVRAAYAADILQRVDLYQPRYINLGMEINSYHMAHPEDFANFVSLFKEVRQQIRAGHPDTIVFVSFQYETLMGLGTGTPQWDLIDLFGSDIDAIGITTYPFTFNSSLGGGVLPADYYSRLTAHTTKPVILAEVGWNGDATSESSLEGQATFLAGLPKLLDGMNVPLVNYNFLFDSNDFGPEFTHMGLLTVGGSQKYAYHAWHEITPAP